MKHTQSPEKKCRACNEIKPLSCFPIKDVKRGYYHSWCKRCFNAHVRSTYNYEKSRDEQLRINYGISSAEYDALFQAQKGVCAGCGQPAALSRVGRSRRTQAISPKLVVDHCHTTGKVRGLLCHTCNQALGLLGDDIQRAYALARYLEKFTDASLDEGSSLSSSKQLEALK